MRTGIDTAPNVLGMVFGHTRSPVYGNDSSPTYLGRTVQATPGMGTGPGFHQPPTSTQSVIHGIANMLVGMFVHIRL